MSSDWPQAHGSPPVSASQVLGVYTHYAQQKLLHGSSRLEHFPLSWMFFASLYTLHIPQGPERSVPPFLLESDFGLPLPFRSTFCLVETVFGICGCVVSVDYCMFCMHVSVCMHMNGYMWYMLCVACVPMYVCVLHVVCLHVWVLPARWHVYICYMWCVCEHADICVV